MSQYSIPLHETYIRMALLTIFLGGFVLYGIYYWCYEMLPWIFPSYWPLWLNIFGYGVYPGSITLYGFMITFLTTSFRSLIPLLAILTSYSLSPLPSKIKSTLIPLDQYRPDVYSIARETASSLDVKLPQCFVWESSEPQAWTSGRRNKNAKLIVTSELLKLDESEVKAVVVHELSHILNKDMAFVTWANNFIKSSKYWFPALCLYIVLSDAFSEHALVFPLLDQVAFLSVNLLFLIVIPFLLINSLSRVREFLADARASLILNDFDPLMSALKEIRRLQVRKKLAELSVPNRLKFASLTKTKANKICAYVTENHPSIDERCEAIEKRTYLKSKSASFEASVWIGVIVAFVTGLLSELIYVFFLRSSILGSFKLTETYFQITALFDFLFPSTLIAIFFSFNVGRRRFVESPSRHRLKETMTNLPLVYYLKETWKKVIISITAFIVISFPWQWVFSTYILFEPFSFWELPYGLFNLPLLALSTSIIMLFLTFMILALIFQTSVVFGLTKPKTKASI